MDTLQKEQQETQDEEQQQKQQDEQQHPLLYRLRQLYNDDPVANSFKLNYQFYLTLLICVFLISKYSETSFVWGMITIVFVSAAGYFSHYVSHRINALSLFQKLDNENYITKNEYVKTGIETFCKLIDFHDQIHHDTNINKKWENIAIEFAMNFYVQAGAFLLVVYAARHLNLYIITLWGLMYATIHNINYDITPSATHMLHHTDKMTNYGIDIWDVVFNTKYEGDVSSEALENINHYAINTAVITGIILLIMNVKVSIKIGF